MKKVAFLLLLLCCASWSYAQKEKTVQWKPYGFVCNYMCYDTRESVNIIDEMFHIMPKDVQMNADGTEDLNDVDKFTYVSIVSRLGLNVTGLQLGKAMTSAKLEADFCGSGSMNTLFRKDTEGPWNLNNYKGPSQFDVRKIDFDHISYYKGNITEYFEYLGKTEFQHGSEVDGYYLLPCLFEADYCPDGHADYLVFRYEGELYLLTLLCFE